MIKFALTTDNGPLTTDAWSGARERVKNFVQQTK